MPYPVLEKLTRQSFPGASKAGLHSAREGIAGRRGPPVGRVIEPGLVDVVVKVILGGKMGGWAIGQE